MHMKKIQFALFHLQHYHIQVSVCMLSQQGEEALNLITEKNCSNQGWTNRMSTTSLFEFNSTHDVSTFSTTA